MHRRFRPTRLIAWTCAPLALLLAIAAGFASPALASTAAEAEAPLATSRITLRDAVSPVGAAEVPSPAAAASSVAPATHAFAQLVELPLGTEMLSAEDLLLVGPEGSRALSVDAVTISPIMIARGRPVAVVSIERSALPADVRETHGLEIVLKVAHRGGATLGMGTSLEDGPQTHHDVYMIIAADQFVSELDDLIAWKTEAGFDVRLHTISEIGAGREQIRQFVTEAYHTWDDPPGYLLLVGDEEHVPTGDVNGYVSDNIYAAVDGEDFLPDIMVGRFSAKTPTDVAVQVAKTVGYESAPDTTSGDGQWFSRALMVAADQGSTTPIATDRWAGEQLLDIGYTRIDSCYQGRRPGHIGSNEGPMCIKYHLDQGATLVGYRGWARGDLGWEYPLYDLTHVPLLDNGWMLPVIFSIVCHTGNFGNDETDCFGEVWMKTGTPEEPRGAVGFVGTAEWWSHSRWNDRMAIGIWEAFCFKGMRRLGDLVADSKMTMLEHFPDEMYMDDPVITLDETCEYYAYIYNTLGDPSLTIWTGRPQRLQVEHPSSMSRGQDHIEVQVSRSGQTPVAGAMVSLAQDGRPIGVAVTDETGAAEVPLLGASQSQIVLTVTGENLYPYRGTLQVTTPSGYLAWTDAVIAGGALMPGVPTDVEIEVTNTGSGSVSNATAELTAPAGAGVANGSLSFGAVGADESATATSPARVTVDADIENGAQLAFTLESSASGGFLNSSQMWLTVSAPELTVTALSDGEDDRFDPGEDAQLLVTLHNAGPAAGEMTLALESVVPGQVTLLDSSAVMAAIATDEEAANTGDPFRLELDEEIAVGAVVPLRLIVDHAEGPQSTLTFNLIVGEVDFSAPSGPDDYGYYCYDSADIDYPDQAPIYEWVECSTLFGGEGEKIEGIADNYWSEVVHLPFSFTYYGVPYDSIRVADNGWIAFDTTDWYDIRNWNMPNEWGCASLVAPFWDNLVPSPEDIPGTDGIYTYHDEERGCFVVEWSRLRNWEDTTDDFQTFQILLCDPAQVTSPTGDGVFVFQYKQIVNDDYTRMYSTVGIEDHTETRGLVYSYSNDYLPGAAPLSPGLAIKFTTEPPVYKAITLASFLATWTTDGTGTGVLSGDPPSGDPSGDPASSEAGVRVSWTHDDRRPLQCFELLRLAAGEEGQWEQAVRLCDQALVPGSGQFLDSSADPEAKYLYRMVGVDRFGKERILGETVYAGRGQGALFLQLPDGNVLGRGGRIAFGAGQAALTELAVYDVSGRMVRNLTRAAAGAEGPGILSWDGRGEDGRMLPGGVYWVRMATTQGDRTARFVMVR